MVLSDGFLKSVSSFVVSFSVAVGLAKSMSCARSPRVSVTDVVGS
jgi:hypothetical protein